MKKFLISVFLLLLMVILVTSMAVLASAATGDHGGYTDAPYWFKIIDISGQLVEPLDISFQNSVQSDRARLNSSYILATHPSYRPDPSDPSTAQTTILIPAMQRYNPNSTPEDCAVGGTFRVPRSDVRTTPANIPYLQFSVTFTAYSTQTGEAIAAETFDPVYFAWMQ
jgi:hypothetical protein